MQDSHRYTLVVQEKNHHGLMVCSRNSCEACNTSHKKLSLARLQNIGLKRQLAIQGRKILMMEGNVNDARAAATGAKEQLMIAHEDLQRCKDQVLNEFYENVCTDQWWEAIYENEHYVPLAAMVGISKSEVGSVMAELKKIAAQELRCNKPFVIPNVVKLRCNHGDRTSRPNLTCLLYTSDAADE